MANFFLFFPNHGHKNDSHLLTNKTGANFEISRLSDEDFLEIQEGKDGIIRNSFHIRDQVMNPRKITVDVDNLERQIEKREELLAQIKEFLPHKSSENQTVIIEYDSSKPETIAESNSEEEVSLNVDSSEYFEQNDNDDSFFFLSSGEESSEFVIGNHDTLANLEDSTHNFLNHPAPLALQSSEFVADSDLIEGQPELTVDQQQLSAGNVSIFVKGAQQNSEFPQKNDEATILAAGRELQNENRNKLLAEVLELHGQNQFTGVALDASPDEMGTANNSLLVDLLYQQPKSAESYEYPEGKIAQNVPTQGYSDEEFEFFEDDEHHLTAGSYESIEDSDQIDFGNVDPSSFKLPSLDIPELSYETNSVDQGVKKPPVQGLLTDNKTATFIFVLLSSLADPTNFISQGLSQHVSDTGHLYGGGHLQDSLTPTPIQLPLHPSNQILSAGEAIGQGSPQTDSPHVRLFKEIASLEPKDCPSPSPLCQNWIEGFCLHDPNYPSSHIHSLLSKDQSLASKYAEVVEQSALDLVPFLTREQEENFDYDYFHPSIYDSSHWFGPQGYICPSRVMYARPVRARNAIGEWKTIVNDGNFYTQTLRIEVCLYPDTPCRLVAPCFRSQCIQKYSYHRLLALDSCQPSKGLHIDMFRLPSACSCYAPSFLGVEDLIAVRSQNADYP